MSLKGWISGFWNWLGHYYSGLGMYEKIAWGMIVLGFVLVIVSLFLF